MTRLPSSSNSALDFAVIPIISPAALSKSVSSTKKVFSHEIRAGIFRYVSTNRLAELETGYSTNEPVQFSVRQAMETAVADIIDKGQQRGFWRAGSQSAIEPAA